MAKSRCLIIRFSSYGDILQGAPLPAAIKTAGFTTVIWLTRDDMKPVVEHIDQVDEIWTIPRKSSVFDIFRMAARIMNSQIDFVYDAHSSLRSNVLLFWLSIGNLIRYLQARPRIRIIQRPKRRFARFLQFQLGRRVFPSPYPGSLSYLEPLNSLSVETKPLSNWPASLKRSHGPRTEKRIALVPSAAWELKRWPAKNYSELMHSFPDAQFTVLGGAGDKICEAISKYFPERTTNLAGKLTFSQSILELEKCQLVIGCDTGLTHAADQLGIPALFLIGPSAFGYPSRKTSAVAEVILPCKPCSKDGRGRCRNLEYQKCLNDLKPMDVSRWAHSLLEKSM